MRPCLTLGIAVALVAMAGATAQTPPAITPAAPPAGGGAPRPRGGAAPPAAR
jgi:hypothetical protein